MFLETTTKESSNPMRSPLSGASVNNLSLPPSEIGQVEDEEEE